MKLLRGRRLYFQNIALLSLRIDFVLTDSAYPDEMSHSAAFYLGLHCLPKYPFRGLLVFKGLKGTATLMITMFYMKDLNKPGILLQVSSKSVEKCRSYGRLNICK